MAVMAKRCSSRLISMRVLEQLGVEVGERLVEQEQAGVPHDATADGHALLLAAGQLPGLRDRAVAQSRCP
jgi:hypothetical protein